MAKANDSVAKKEAAKKVDPKEVEVKEEKVVEPAKEEEVAEKEAATELEEIDFDVDKLATEKFIKMLANYSNSQSDNGEAVKDYVRSCIK